MSFSLRHTTGRILGYYEGKKLVFEFWAYKAVRPGLSIESVFEDIVKRNIDIRRILEIFIKHRYKIYIISEWIAARDTMALVRKDIKIEITTKEMFEPTRKFKEGLATVAQREIELRNTMHDLFGKKSMNELTRKNMKRWPVFSELMTDLYEYLFPYFKRRKYTIYKKQSPGWAIYPQELLKMIADLLKAFDPIFNDFTPNHVKSRIKSHAK